MKPTLYDIRVDPILSNVSVAYKNDDYVAEQVLPIIPSKLLTGKYYKYDQGKFRKVQTLRGMGSAAREVGYGMTISDAYVIKDHALKEIVPNELLDQALSPLTPSEDAAENVTEKLLIEKEYDLATYMQSHTNLTNYIDLDATTANDQWNDYANSDPLDDIQTGKAAIHAKIFKAPNVFLVSKPVFDKLIDHPDIIDRIKYTQLGTASEELLARLIGVDKVIVAGAGYNTAKEGQTDSMSYIWGKDAWLLYVAPRPGIKNISFGYHFQKGVRVEDKWYDKDREGTWVRVHDRYTREIISVDCAYLFEDAIA